jgi:hypothetical protein
MNIPISGMIVMAVTLWFLVMRPDDMVILALVLNAFAAAAVLNIGGGFPIGIAPYYFAAMLVTLRLIPRWISGKIRFFEGEPAAAYARAMALFVVVCAVSAFLLPNLFDGLPVDIARNGVSTQHHSTLGPLHWSMSNGGQTVYVLLDFFVIVDLLRKCEQEGFYKTPAKAFTVSGILAAGVGLFQVACTQVGLKFPAWLFNSNAAWAQNTHQVLSGGYSRMSATFVEPSVAGGFFACWMVFELTLAISSRRAELWHWLFATIATMALFLTTSSTGYLIAVVSWSFAVVQTSATLFGTGVIRIRKAAAILGAVGGATLALLLIPGVWGLLDAVLFEKQLTGSAIDRTATLGRAVDVFVQTWGLGAGLGSNRAMSLVFYVLSNLGLLGTVLFLYLLVKAYLMARVATRSPEVSRDLIAFIRASGVAFAANLVGMIVSGAEISGSQFWILLGMLLVGVRQAWLLENGLQSDLENERPIIYLDEMNRPEASFDDPGGEWRMA